MHNKEQIQNHIEDMGLKFNSLTKGQAIALLARIIADETGCERKDMLPIAVQIDDLNGLNVSAMRQKINTEFFGKRADSAKQTAAEIAADLI